MSKVREIHLYSSNLIRVKYLSPSKCPIRVNAPTPARETVFVTMAFAHATLFMVEKTARRVFSFPIYSH